MSIDVQAPEAGVITELLVEIDATVNVGSVLAKFDAGPQKMLYRFHRKNYALYCLHREQLCDLSSSSGKNYAAYRLHWEKLFGLSSS